MSTSSAKILGGFLLLSASGCTCLHLRPSPTDCEGDGIPDARDRYASPGSSCQGRQLLAGHRRPELSKAPWVGPVPSETVLHLAIGLPIRDPEGLTAFNASVSDPSDPNYRKYLTPQQLTEKFGPSAEGYERLAQWATRQGLAVSTVSNRLLLDIAGTAAQVNRALHVTMNHYRRLDGTPFFAPDREPSIDSDVPVLHISGLDNYVVPRPSGGSGSSGLYVARDLRAAYTSCTPADGAGESVGIFAYEGFDPTDVAAYQAAAGLPSVPVEAVLLNGVSGAPTPDNGEVSLDIEMAMALAPGLTRVVVFYGLVDNDILNAMATRLPLSAQLSSSWFHSTDANTQQIVNAFAAQGQSFFQASGDSGGLSGDPHGVHHLVNATFVGGTVLRMNGAGVSYASELGWSGSSGGVLTSVPFPGFQSGIDMSTNGGSTAQRNFPDVAMVADELLVVETGRTMDGRPIPGVTTIGAGTSASAPLWASFMALVNQRSRERGLGVVGYPNPALYAIGRDPALYAANFNDVATGSNGPFTAVAGYDLVTGLGSPKCALIEQLASDTPTGSPAFSQIQLTISTGNDNLGDHGSGAIAELYAPGATTPFQTLTLKPRGGSTWDNGSVHDQTFQLDAPRAVASIDRIVLRLVQDSCELSCDNWTVQAVSIRLLRPGAGPQRCLIDLVGGPDEINAVARLKFGGGVDTKTFRPTDGCP
jgi:kumamolisin